MPLILLVIAFYFSVIGNAVAAVSSFERRHVQLVLFLAAVVFILLHFRKLTKHNLFSHIKIFLKYLAVSTVIASVSLLNILDSSLSVSAVVNYLSACIYIAILLSMVEIKGLFKSKITHTHVLTLSAIGLLIALIAYFKGPNTELDAHIDFYGSSILLGSLSVISIFSIHTYFFSKSWQGIPASILYSFPFYYLLFLSTSRGAIFIFFFLFILFVIRAIYFFKNEKKVHYLFQIIVVIGIFSASLSSIFVRSSYYPYYSFSNANPELSVELRNLEFMLRYSRFLRLINDYLSEETRESIRKYIEERAALVLKENYETIGKIRLNAGLGTNLKEADERFEMYREFFEKRAPWNGYWPVSYNTYTKVSCGRDVGPCSYPHNVLIEAYYNYGILFFVLSFIAILAANLLAAYHVIVATEIMAVTSSLAVIVISLLSMYTSKFSDYLVYAPVLLLFAYYKQYYFSFFAVITNLKQNFLKKNFVKTTASK